MVLYAPVSVPWVGTERVTRSLPEIGSDKQRRVGVFGLTVLRVQVTRRQSDAAECAHGENQQQPERSAA